MWQSFHFDENVETLDSSVTHIRQVSILLIYGGPQTLEVFKNTSYKIILDIIPTEDIRQAVETGNRILTKEKIDRQLAGQSSTTPFMSITDIYNNKKVTFDMQNGLEDKIERLTVMMSKLAANGDGANSSNLRHINKKGEVKQEISMTDRTIRYITNSRDRRIQFSGRIQYGQNYRGRPRYGQNYRNDFRRGNFRGSAKAKQNQNFEEDRIVEVDIEETIGMKIMKEVEDGLEKGHIQVISEGMTGVIATVYQGQDQE